MGIKRIETVFHKEHPAFMPYMVLGYPTLKQSIQTAGVLAECGADLLELGIPFSDPLADGPTIQAATQQALKNGITLKKCIETTAGLRQKGINVPALMMSYFNPILAYGIENCIQDSAKAGIDGFIIPDLPPEEAEAVEQACKKADLGIVYLLSPNSPPERVRKVIEKTTGFIYLVSLTGVTGARAQLPDHLAEFVSRIRKQTDKPLVVGFGISNGEQAAEVGKFADGVIVGSALVKKSAGTVEDLRELATELRESLNTVER